MNGDLFIALIAVIVAGWWVWSLAWHPSGPCRRCAGRRGRNIGSSTTRWGRCGKCGGTGERARFGARTVRRTIRRPL